MANILDAEFQHGDPLHAHPEGKTGHLFRVITDETKHLRIDHAGAEDLKPASPPAHAASLLVLCNAFSAAKHAFDVDLCAGFGEREETRAETDLSLRAENPAYKVGQHPFEIGEGDMAVHHEALHLMEHRRVSRIIVVTVNRSGDDDLERGVTTLHDADLNRRGMGPEHALLRDEKGILHVPRGMILGHIEGLEIMIVILDVGAAGNLESHPQKNVYDNFEALN